jgi:hypothetical protein
MTARIDFSPRLGVSARGSIGRGCACRTALPTSTGLNGIARLQTNSTKEAHSSTQARTPWAAIVIAIVVVTLVVGAELFAARHAPSGGTVASSVASEVSATLGDVAASSILIDP